MSANIDIVEYQNTELAQSQIPQSGRMYRRDPEISKPRAPNRKLRALRIPESRGIGISEPRNTDTSKYRYIEILVSPDLEIYGR